MNTPFNKSFCGKSPLNELTARQEANLPEALKTAIEAKSPTNYGSPLNQASMDVSSKKLEKKPVKKELSWTVKDSLQNIAIKRGKGFYSKKHKVYVDGEDGVLAHSPKRPNNYERL